MSETLIVEVPVVSIQLVDEGTTVLVSENVVQSVEVSTPTVSLSVEENITNLSVSLLGAQGIQGVKGDSAFFYDHDQSTPSAVWTITHNLNAYPVATVFDSAGAQCEGLFGYPSLNVMTITFSAAFSGRAYVI